jgi:hypothetical protein
VAQEEGISMFRKSLLAATALVLCVSVTFGGPKTGQSGVRISLRDAKPGFDVRLDHRMSPVVMAGKAGAPVHNNASHWVPHATFNNFSKDRNAEFLSWYGFSVMNIEGPCGSNSGCTFSEIAGNAIPIVGTGHKVTKILVPLFSLASPSSGFNVGIYSATPSGFPAAWSLPAGRPRPATRPIAARQFARSM